MAPTTSAALPGVLVATAACCVPLDGGYGLPFTVMGRPLQPGTAFHGGGGWLTISPGYFDAFRIPVVRGRAFTERDDAGATPVVIINQTMARRFWPKADPLADKIWIGHGIMSELAAEHAAANRRHRGRHSRWRPEPRPRPYHVRAQPAGARCPQRAQRADHAPEVDRAHARQSVPV